MQIISFLFEKHLDKTVLVIAVILSILMLSADDDSQINSARAISSFLFYPVDRAGAYFSDMEQLKEDKISLLEAQNYRELCH